MMTTFFILAVVGIILLGMLMLIVNLHQFLAKTVSVSTDILVVEGWIPDYAIKAAMEEFYAGGYKTLITIGSTLPRGFYLSEYKNFAELSAATLIALGFDPQQLVVVAVVYSQEHRTKNTAIALKEYLATSDKIPQSMNIFTLGPHGRRTWLIFRSVFPSVAVGIISAKSSSYGDKDWWKSSEGVRGVIGELIAYLYQRLWG